MSLTKRSKRVKLEGLLIGLRIVLGAVLVLAAISKFEGPSVFLGQVYSYEMVGPETGRLIAGWLPGVELVCGSCLLSGVFVRGAMLCSLALSVLFVAAQSHALRRGLSISCGCFGSSPTRQEIVGLGTLLRAVLMFIASFAGFVVSQCVHGRGRLDLGATPSTTAMANSYYIDNSASEMASSGTRL